MTNRGSVRVNKAITAPTISAHLWGLASEELAGGSLDSINCFKWELIQLRSLARKFNSVRSQLHFNDLSSSRLSLFKQFKGNPYIKINPRGKNFLLREEESSFKVYLASVIASA